MPNLEQSLFDEKIISKEQLQTVKLEMQRGSLSLVKSIRRLKFIPEDTLIDFLSKKLQLPKFELKGFTPEEEVISLLPQEFMWKEKIIPISKVNDELSLGILDPMDVAILEEVRFRTGLFIKPHLVKEDDLNNLLMGCCDRRKSSEAERGAASAADQAQLMEEGTKPSVVEAVDLLLLQAYKVNASDIHIEPHKDRMRMRLRVDGVLAEISPPEEEIYNAIVSRIKIMSNLDIAEKRLPQDGRFNVDLKFGVVDVRVSVLPTIQGESIVLRLLKQNKKLLTLEELGMDNDNLQVYLKLVRRPAGIVLVTGPTGSGKTTSLYATLLILKGVEKNIITVEDPAEYQLDFARQIQVNPKVNLTFATGLRSILRHDPDIIMVGEIRDLETATIAIQAALTGHLVISTLHTNDAVSAITRLIDMGIEPFLISSCLNGVVAQRLLRSLCPKCKKRVLEADIDFKSLNISEHIVEKIKKSGIYESVGCQECLNTGFSGRSGVFEVMEMTPEIGRMTVEKVTSTDIMGYLRKQGKRFLRDDGWQKVAEGSTSPQELMRVLGQA